jgi:hypothetical protein
MQLLLPDAWLRLLLPVPLYLAQYDPHCTPLAVRVAEAQLDHVKSRQSVAQEQVNVAQQSLRESWGQPTPEPEAAAVPVQAEKSQVRLRRQLWGQGCDSCAHLTQHFASCDMAW